MSYKHTQISYPMIGSAVAVTALFVWTNMQARLEAPSADSGTNLLVTGMMSLIIFVVASFTTLTVTVDDTNLAIKFGLGIYKRKFPLNDIASARTVKNKWYYGWGIRWWPRPKMQIFNVAGLNAIELTMNNGRTYRIGTDEPENLATAIGGHTTLHSVNR